MNPHLQELIDRFPRLSVCSEDISRTFETMCTCYRADGKLLLCGNGGSAADAEHWSGEMLKGFKSLRPLDDGWKTKMPHDVAASLQGALRAIPLTGFLSASSAFANDVDAQYTFAQLVWALGDPEDVLVGISTSGNARNVCYAMDVAEAKGMETVALTGQDGGALAGKANVAIRVPETETLRVQELHLPVYHCLCLMLEDEFFGETR